MSRSKRSPSPANRPAGGTDFVPVVQQLVKTVDSLRDEVRDRDQRWIETIGQLIDRLESNAAVPDIPAAGGQTSDWQTNRELILRQMEEDQFDAEAFLRSLPDDPSLPAGQTVDDATDDPGERLDGLLGRLRRAEQSRAEQAEEIEDLRQALAYRRHEADESGSPGRGIDAETGATGAHAIAELLADDSVIAAERQRASQCTEKLQQQLREAEVEASLQRAELARRSSELRIRETQLQEKFDDLQRQLDAIAQPADRSPDGRQTRWLRRKS